MSESHPPPRSIDRVVDEARRHFGPETHGEGHDWRAADDALFARLAREERLVSHVPARRPMFAIATGVALAAAAAATLFFRPAPAPVREGVVAAATVAAPGEGLRILDARGTARSLSAPVGLGDRIETAGAAAGFVSRDERGERAVDWRVEGATRLAIAAVRAPLGLTLESGAIEADVTKVKSGEAFVVDVGGTRVAVRGTHLRVARDGTHATVDLSEGTIAIGPVPLAGLTEGALVRAPAHVEIDLAQGGAVNVDGRASAVRPPTFAHDVRTADAAAMKTPTTPAPSAAEPTIAPPIVPRPTTTAPLKPLASADPRTPTAVVGDAVVACIEKHVPASARHVTITSTLVLDIDAASGAVKIARFDPPLPPEVQTCSSETIYKTRFSGSANERIAIRAER